MDDIDRQLLSLLQQGVPVRSQPFEVMGRKLGIDTAETLLRIGSLRAHKLFERISGVFDARKLGYKSTLVAMSFGADELEAKAALIHQHPGVGLSQVMENELNFWFTLAVPAYHLVETHLARLHELSGSKRTLALPVVESFKPYMKASLKDSWFRSSREPVTVHPPDFSPLDIEVIRLLQEDLPLCDEPFKRWANGLNAAEEDILKTVHQLIQNGYLRNIRAVMTPPKHEEHACLLVWEIPEEKLEAIGQFVAHYNEVSHCVSRLAYPEFPYNLYAMLRVSAHMNWQDIVQKIEVRIGKWSGLRLPVIRSNRRKPVKYFAKELESWEMLNALASPPRETAEAVD